MRLFDWMQGNVNKMRWYDISFLKLSVFFATLLLVNVWEGFRNTVMMFEWYWYLILMVVFMIPLLKRTFCR